MLRNFGFILLISVGNFAHGSTARDILNDYSIQIDDASTFAVLKNQKMSGAKNQHIIELQSKNKEHVEIKIISPVDKSAATAMIDAERSVVKKLYAAPQTPYMGDIAQAIGACPAKFGPVQSEIQLLTDKRNAVIGAANPERAFGACDSAKAKFRGALVAYYDEESKSVWTWRVFSPWSDKKPLGSHWLSAILGQFKR